MNTSTHPDQTAQARPYRRITVIGAGAWGTALAFVAARGQAEVRLWGRDAEHMAEMGRTRRNPRYLSDLPLPDTLHPTADLAAALAEAQAVLIVVPSSSIRSVTAEVAAKAPPGIPFFVCAKGIEAATGFLMSQVVADAAPGHLVGAISGPTFARETAMGQPTAVTVACASSADMPAAERAATRMAMTIATETFRPYVSDDLVGVEIGGAVKNVIAIACGMAAGAGFGDNTRAALVTRGLAEIKELADRLGGRRETVTGLGGLGDLMLTCSSPQSRNFSYGMQRGEGVAEDAVFDGAPVTVEGRVNAVTVTDLARARNLHMPICEMVRAIVEEGAPIRPSFAAYWSAPIEAEPRDLDLTLAHPVGGEV